MESFDQSSENPHLSEDDAPLCKDDPLSDDDVPLCKDDPLSEDDAPLRKKRKACEHPRLKKKQAVKVRLESVFTYVAQRKPKNKPLALLERLTHCLGAKGTQRLKQTSQEWNKRIHVYIARQVVQHEVEASRLDGLFRRFKQQNQLPSASAVLKLAARRPVFCHYLFDNVKLLSYVVDFLEARSLFKLLLVAKWIRVKVTHDMALRCALQCPFITTHHRSRLKNYAQGFQAGVTFPATPNRILYFALCSRLNCDKGCRAPVFITSRTGMALCRHCANTVRDNWFKNNQPFFEPLQEKAYDAAVLEKGRSGFVPMHNVVRFGVPIGPIWTRESWLRVHLPAELQNAPHSKIIRYTQQHPELLTRSSLLEKAEEYEKTVVPSEWKADFASWYNCGVQNALDLTRFQKAVKKKAQEDTTLRLMRRLENCSEFKDSGCLRAMCDCPLVLQFRTRHPTLPPSQMNRLIQALRAIYAFGVQLAKMDLFDIFPGNTHLDAILITWYQKHPIQPHTLLTITSTQLNMCLTQNIRAFMVSKSDLVEMFSSYCGKLSIPCVGEDVTPWSRFVQDVYLPHTAADPDLTQFPSPIELPSFSKTTPRTIEWSPRLEKASQETWCLNPKRFTQMSTTREMLPFVKPILLSRLSFLDSCYVQPEPVRWQFFATYTRYLLSKMLIQQIGKGWGHDFLSQHQLREGPFFQTNK